MICAILLAAGRSQRMGTQKLLMPFGPDQTVIGQIAAQLLGTPLHQILAVSSPSHFAAVQRALPPSDPRLSVITNPDPAGDMLSSVRCGLRHLPLNCDAALVALGDQPSIKSDLVCRLLQAFRASGRPILVPSYAGKRGHPLLFSLRYRDEILASYDEIGLRGLLSAHPQDVLELEVTTASILSDMDNPADYRRELAARREGIDRPD